MAGALVFGSGHSVTFGTIDAATTTSAVLPTSSFANAAVGDCMIALIHGQSSTGTVTVVPSGWTAVGAAPGSPTSATSRISQVYYYPIRTSTDVTNINGSHTWTLSNSGRLACVAARATGIDLNNPVDVGATAWTAGTGGAVSVAAAAVTTVKATTLLVGAVFAERSASTNNAGLSTWLTAFSEYVTTATSSTANTHAGLGYAALSSAGSTGTQTATYPSGQTNLSAELVAFKVGPWQGDATATTTIATTTAAARSDTAAVTATTTSTATVSASSGANVTATTTVAVTATASAGTVAAATASTTAAVTTAASVVGATVIVGTPVERNSTTNTIVVPTGVTSTMIGLFVLGTSTSTDNGSVLVKSGATFTSLDARAAGNMFVNVIKATGLVAGDTITLTQTATGTAYIQHFYQDQYDFVPSSLAAVIRGSSVATCTTGSVTPAGGQRVSVVSLERTTATGTTVSSVTATGSETVTQDAYSESAGSTAVSIYLGYFNSSAAAARTATVTYNSASTNGYAATILTAPFVGVGYVNAPTTASVVTTAGTAIANVTATTVVSATTVAGLPSVANASATTTVAVTATANTTSPANVYPPGYASVTALLADSPNIRVAHRGGSADWPEMSFYAYQQSVNRGVKALEVSLARTSDGVWFGLHDATLDRTSGLTAGTNLDPSTITWATLIANYTISADQPAGQTAKPYMRLEQLLAAYGSTHVFFLDPKNDVANLTGLLDLCDSCLGGSAGTSARVVIKYYGVSGMTIPNAAAARSIKTWGYFYETDSASFASFHARWDILGLDYTATSGSWSTFVGYGQPLLGHIIPSASALATTLALGANGAMVSGVLEAIPQVGTTTSTVTAAAVRTDSRAVTATTTVATTVAAARPDTAAAAPTTTVTVTTAAARSGTAAVTATTTVAATVAATVPGTAQAAPVTTVTVTTAATRSDAAAVAATTTSTVTATASSGASAVVTATTVVATSASAAVGARATPTTVVAVTTAANTSSPAALAAATVIAATAVASASSPTTATAVTVASVLATAVLTAADPYAAYYAGEIVDLVSRYHAGVSV